MGYIDYMNVFNRWLEADSPTDKVIILYYGLLNTFNRRGWPVWAGIDTQRLMILARTTDKKTALRARDTLARAGFIEYKRGKRGRATEYRLLEYSGKFLPGNATENATIRATENATTNKIKTKTKKKTSLSGGGEGVGTSEGERAVWDFTIEHYGSLDVYLGMTEEIKAEAGAVAEELFSLYTNRHPTKMDVAKVYSCVRPLEGGVVLPFPEERVQLLSYAFQAANKAGKPGDWRYIEGTLGRIHRRGQTTPEEADDFDDLLAELRRNGGHGQIIAT